MKVMKEANLKQQLEAYDNGQFLESDGDVNTGCYLFYDWFCKQESLERRARRLFGSLRTFLKHHPEIDQTKHYVFFKNNCPMVGSLYDDFRICDMETGNVIWNVTPKSGHSGMAEVWGVMNEWKAPIQRGFSYRELFQ
jgi:hypothetical protein